MICRVLVDVPVKAVDRLFDYEIPSEYQDILEIGMRVIVPFGNRELMGYCLEIADKSEYEDHLKPIKSLLDLESFLTEELIDLAKKIQEDTSSVLIRVIETMLPSALRTTYKTLLRVMDRQNLPEILKPYFENIDERYLDQELASVLKPIKEAVKNNTIKQSVEVKSKANPRQVRIVRLLKNDSLPKTDKQKMVIAYLEKTESNCENFQTLLKELSITSSVVDTLSRQGFIEIIVQEEYRELFSLQPNFDKQVILNAEQEIAYDKIIAKLDQNQMFLLHGVTSSGKTEIYLKVIETVLKKNQEVIFLVPEISLTPMMVSRFKSRFHDQVAILHSGLSVGEKFDEWRKIIRKEVKIVIGARSACFAPFTNLGLIVVDECHESTYKQDEMPKYYALDVLDHRAIYYNIPMLMGSATPNIESYARYKRGYFELLELKKRAQNSSLPELKIVDMKQEFKNGNFNLLSDLLYEEIKTRLEKQEQTILLLNRRGHSTFVICRNCGFVFTCPQCDISLTYHEADHTLKCHYCNHKQTVPKTCAKCNSEDLRYFGSGTQKIEAELSERFPQAKVVRMDNDTTRTKNAHEKLLFQFEHDGDILLGTQMIAKGLDFPNVTLVGIIQADGNLYSPDFRAPEKTFQLITQVSGRAGRRDVSGKVIIQAFNPDHYAIQYAYNHDYLGFYEHEMGLRKLAKYVPFYFLVQVLFVGEKMRDLFVAAKAAVGSIRQVLTAESIVLGPSLPIIPKIKNLYSCQVIIKYRNEPKLNQLLTDIKDKYENQLVRITIDKSPTLS